MTGQPHAAASGPGRFAEGPGERLRRVEQEIRRAQAEALGRTGERLQALLDRLGALDRGLDALMRTLPDTDEGLLRLGAETEARNRLREQAIDLRHDLIIQREALGIVCHAPVEQRYPVPDRRRAPGSDRAPVWRKGP